MLRSILCLLLTLVGTVKSVEELFAIIGGTNCAEQLSFGNQPILPSGSADGQHPYFLSTSSASAHTSWTQIVTSDGIIELFRIYWSFSTAKTVTDRIASAVRKGEAVSYRVVDASTGQEHSSSGMWRFSSTSQTTTDTFLQPESGFLSANSGAFGAGGGTIDGAMSNSVDFWGVGNFQGDDDTECSKVYKNGVGHSYETNMKVFLYFSTSTSAAYEMPTFSPTKTPKVVGLHVQQQIDGVTISDYQAHQTRCMEVYELSLHEIIKTQGKGFIDELTISAVTQTLHLRHHVADSSDVRSIILDYMLTVRRTGSGSVSYAKVANLLEDSSTNDKFTLLLQQYALDQGVTPLRSVTTTSINTQYVTVADNSSGEKSKPTVPLGLIIGFSAGLLVTLFVCGYACTYGCTHKQDIPYAVSTHGEQTFTFCDCTEISTHNNASLNAEGKHAITEEGVEMRTLIAARCVDTTVVTDPTVVPVAEVTSVRFIPLF